MTCTAHLHSPLRSNAFRHIDALHLICFTFRHADVCGYACVCVLVCWCCDAAVLCTDCGTETHRHMRESNNISHVVHHNVTAQNAICAAHSPSIPRTTSHHISSHHIASHHISYIKSHHMARRWRHERQLMRLAAGRMSILLGVTATTHATMMTIGSVLHCQRKWRYPNMYTGAYVYICMCMCMCMTCSHMHVCVAQEHMAELDTHDSHHRYKR